MTTPTRPVAGQKRKAGSDLRDGSSLSRKRQKGRDAKAIPSQPAAAALSASGELNIAAFVKAREFEISALDSSMQNAKKGLTTRAFQGVPRSMRRRTASHNAKKVPKRLRPRAEREMKEDNTPTITARRRVPSRKLRLRMQTVKMIQMWSKKAKTVRQKKKESKLNKQQPDPEKHISVSRVPRIKKNTLTAAPTATSKFKKRQVRKAWLPTHLWHAKRARMTKPTQPLWRMAIPLSPTEKSYRPTHRAGGSRGCVAWDMSYISTVACQGVGLSLENMLKALGFNGEGWSGPKFKRWRQGKRSADGWAFERDNDKPPIAPITVIWYSEASTSEKDLDQRVSNSSKADGEDVVMSDVTPNIRSKSKSPKERLMIRVHPSAFHQFWTELLKVAKLQRPQVLIEDLRFEIGAIEITGPGSTEALIGVLSPSKQEAKESGSLMASTWTELAGLNNPAYLPPSALLSFNIEDPRLHHPPKQVKIPKGESQIAALTELIVSWPPDDHPSLKELFSHKSRYTATKSLKSQKAINRQRSQTLPGQSPPSNDKDPQIPIILLAFRQQSGQSNAQGSWTVLLPWKCVDPVWRSLLYYPLNSGRVPRFGGLDEKRQIAFEHGQAWFPGDSPGSEAGKAWERTESCQRFDDWARRPPARRVAWETLDLRNGAKGEHGNGWACDWEYLFRDAQPSSGTPLAEQTSDAEPRSAPPASQEPTGSKPLTQRQRKAAKAKEQAVVTEKPETEARRRNTSSPESDFEDNRDRLTSELKPTPAFTQITSAAATRLLKSHSLEDLPRLASLFTVRITFLTRGTPNPCARIYRLPTDASSQDSAIKALWLALDPTSKSPNLQPTNSTSNRPYNPKPHLKKIPTNRHNQPRTPSHLPLENTDHIQYLPPDAHPDVVAQYGPKPPNPDADAHAALIANLTNPNITAEERDSHPPCPSKEDLLGYVTSGAYNLAEGRGVAIGSLWLQRLLEGWVRDGGARGDAKAQKKRDRERRLCVVRNAGEDVGRLAVWEVCGCE